MNDSVTKADASLLAQIERPMHFTNKNKSVACQGLTMAVPIRRNFMESTNVTSPMCNTHVSCEGLLPSSVISFFRTSSIKDTMARGNFWHSTKVFCNPWLDQYQQTGIIVELCQTGGSDRWRSYFFNQLGISSWWWFNIFMGLASRCTIDNQPSHSLSGKCSLQSYAQESSSVCALADSLVKSPWKALIFMKAIIFTRSMYLMKWFGLILKTKSLEINAVHQVGCETSMIHGSVSNIIHRRKSDYI